jgi:hypothetical protein
MPSNGPIIYVKLFIFVVVLCLFAFIIMGSQQPAYYYSSPSLPEPANESNYMNPVNHQGLSGSDNKASGASGTSGYTTTPPDNVEPDDQEEGYDEDNEDLAPP